MSVRFDAAADRLLRTTDLPDYNGVWAWCAWGQIAVDLNANSAFYSENDNTTGNVDLLRTTTAGDVLEIRVVVAGAATTVGGGTLTVGTWYHLALVRESAASLKLYIDGALSATNTRDVTGRAAASRQEMGGFRSTNTFPLDGKVFATKVWAGGTALTLAEVQQEMRTVRPVRLTNLYGWWPLRPGSTERLKDYSGNGRDWTEAGTLADEDHPPISWGAPGGMRIMPPVAAAGGQPTMRRWGGSIDPIGARRIGRGW